VSGFKLRTAMVPALYRLSAAGLAALLALPAAAAEPGDRPGLTLAAEARLRYAAFDDAQLARGNDYRQGQFRGVAGAELRLSPALRFFGEVGTGQVEGRRRAASAGFQNDAALQQLYVDVRGRAGQVLLGAAAGRMEFADAPRQLLSIGDGANLHRTWNGVRLYAQAPGVRFGAFDFRVTRPGRGAFDDGVRSGERLRGANAGLALPLGGAEVKLDPFWLRTVNPAFRAGDRTGRDRRDTVGARLRVRRGPVAVDWTAARQTGRFLDRPVEAWGLFAMQSVALSAEGWKPRLGLRIDAASGGGTYGTGTVRAFNQLYASSGYLGEGLFLSTSNLLMAAPGLSVAPTPSTTLSAEYGVARRLTEDDAAYAGQMRPHPGTRNVPGHRIGGLLRVAGTWTATEHLTLSVNHERLAAGPVLRRAGRSSGSYSYLSATLRY